MKSQNPKHAESQENSEYFPKSQDGQNSTRAETPAKPIENQTDLDSKSGKHVTQTDHTASVRHH